MMCGIYLLLGSNLGDKQKNIDKAITAIAEICEIKNTSSVYETSAWGKTDQPSFYNLVLEICTSTKPEKLLLKLLQIEKSLGRIRKEKWGERVIDIDILYFQDLIIDTEELSVPHPGIPQRKFTLVPLVELNSKLMNSITLKSNQQMLTELTDDSLVNKIR